METKVEQKQVLAGHTSAETAYVVDDYPYGFRLRCKIRYWLEFKPGKGFRLMSQTTNPKVAGEVWNKPNASTYAKFGAVIYLDEKKHVTWSGVHEYSSEEELKQFMEWYGQTLPEAALLTLKRLVLAKELYEQKKAAGMEYRQAAREASIEAGKSY